MKTGRWREAFSNRYLVALLAAGTLLSAALLITPLSGRAWPVLMWSALVYVGAAAIWAYRTSGSIHPEQPRATREITVTPRVQSRDLVRPMEEALRRLNNPSALAEASLAGHLPCTLKQLADRDRSLIHRGRHGALRVAVVEAIERLKPTEGTGAGEQGLSHAILHEEYVLGHSTARIMGRYSISESTFHRYRREAIRAVAQELAIQEEALSGHAM